MKKRILILWTIICPLFLQGQAADTSDISRKLVSAYDRTDLFRNQAWQNAAIRYHLYPFSLTAASAGGVYEKRGKAALAQEGNGGKQFNVQVHSFVVLNPHSRLFGSASYRNGRREKVVWNENSDFALLYPYVTGDSIGGFMQEEAYAFSGGYAHCFGPWIMGAELDYRAMIAYRDKDPRPRNIVSDLTGSLALSRRLGETYILGLSVQVRKYNQRSDIKYLADKGPTAVYQMLGLGMDYVRFAGSQNSARYNGSGIGGSIDLLPAGKADANAGFSASLRAGHFHLTKELVSINYAPINEARHASISLETAWIQRKREREYGVRLLTAWQRRTGIENIFGDPTANVYPKISSTAAFRNTTHSTALQGMMGQRLYGKRRWGWTLLPGLNYGQTRSAYKANGRHADIATASGGLEVQSLWRLPAILLSANIAGGYTTNVRTAYALPGLDSRSSAGSTLLSNLGYLSDDHASMNLQLRGDYAVHKQYALFLSAHWLHQAYKHCGRTDRIEVSLGITF